MEPKRKATDAILKIEEDLTKIRETISNFDHNMKLILARTNQLHDLVSLILNPVSKDSGLELKYNQDNIAHTNKEQSFAEASASIQVAVRQKVELPDGKVAGFATVEILDKKGLSVCTVKTNTTGHWMASLFPGEYNVSIIKKNFHGEFSLLVEKPKEGPLVLDPILLKN